MNKIQAVIRHNDLYLILLRRKKKDWVNVTGHVKSNEKLMHGLLREIREETGLRRSNIKRIIPLFCFSFKKGNKNVRETVFLVEVNTTEVDISKNPDNEHLLYAWAKNSIAIKLIKIKPMRLALRIAEKIKF